MTASPVEKPLEVADDQTLRALNSGHKDGSPGCVNLNLCLGKSIGGVQWTLYHATQMIVFLQKGPVWLRKLARKPPGGTHSHISPKKVLVFLLSQDGVN